MDLNKYSELREKIRSQNFETKNKDINKTLNVFSYVGNIGSIFFAFFLIYPALLKAISANLIDGDISKYIAGSVTTLILFGFELLKRKVLANLSFDIIKNKFKVQRSLISWFIFSILIIGASFYFSLNGAVNFASTSKIKNDVIEVNINSKIDSINNLYNERKQVLIEDNNGLRVSNKEYRDNIAEMPDNYRLTRNDLQKQIDSNNESITKNDERINTLDIELKNIISEIKDDQVKEQNENENEDFSNILLFLILSTSIEFLIVLGVFFDKYYDYNVYLGNMKDLEGILKKRDRYKIIIKFIYKEGNLSENQPIIGKSILLDLIKEKSSISNPNKFLDGFLNDMEYLDILKLNGKRRYTVISYQDALNKIDKFDDTLRLLEKLF